MAKAGEIIGLDCDASTSVAIRLVLSARLNEMCALRAAALDWSDPEGVHDMRVASRRLRSALKDFSPYLRESKLRGPANELKRIARALGDVRDHDVAIMELEKKASDAPTDVAAGIGQLISELYTTRKRARAALAKVIGKRNLAQFQSDFESSLEGALKVSRRSESGKGSPDKVGSSFREAGRDIIKANLQKVRDLSASLYAPFKPKPLHRMRIGVKRLRYATKLLAPCWTDALDPFDKEIAKLQTSLGALHDCDSWIAELGGNLNPAKVGPGASTDPPDGSTGSRVSSKVRKAAAEALQIANARLWLLDHFVESRTEHYRSALKYWHEWEVTGFQDRLFAVFEAKPPAVDLVQE